MRRSSRAASICGCDRSAATSSPDHLVERWRWRPSGQSCLPRSPKAALAGRETLAGDDGGLERRARSWTS